MKNELRELGKIIRFFSEIVLMLIAGWVVIVGLWAVFG